MNVVGHVRVDMRPVKQIMARLGMAHVPHECRHTFESLLDSAGANSKCIDLLMGHVSKDTGNRVYNHKTLDELKTALELVQRKSLLPMV